jgi:hypothetical protein
MDPTHPYFNYQQFSNNNLSSNNSSNVTELDGANNNFNRTMELDQSNVLPNPSLNNLRDISVLSGSSSTPSMSLSPTLIRQDDPESNSSSRSAGQLNKAPAKITMNIPSFLPKIQPPTTTSAAKNRVPILENKLPPGMSLTIVPSSPTIVSSPRGSPKSSSTVNAFTPSSTAHRPQTASLKQVNILHAQQAPGMVQEPRQSLVRPSKPVGRVQSNSSTFWNPAEMKQTQSAPNSKGVGTGIQQQKTWGDHPKHTIPAADPLSICSEQDPLAADPLLGSHDSNQSNSQKKCDVPGCPHANSSAVSLFSIPLNG